MHFTRLAQYLSTSCLFIMLFPVCRHGSRAVGKEPILPVYLCMTGYCTVWEFRSLRFIWCLLLQDAFPISFSHHCRIMSCSIWLHSPSARSRSKHGWTGSCASALVYKGTPYSCTLRIKLLFKYHPADSVEYDVVSIGRCQSGQKEVYPND